MTRRTRYRARILLPAAAAFGIFGCAVDTSPELGESTPDGLTPNGERELPPAAEQVDATVGDLCIYANDPPATPMSTFETRVTPGDTLVVEVTLPTCLSGSCDVRRRARCDIARSDDALTITADFEYVTHDDDFCTLDCQVLTATCETGPLPAGEYVIAHAGQSEELVIPSTMESCVIEPQFCERHTDCDDGFCGQTLAGNAICREYSGSGEPCGGYGAPGTAGAGLCAPGLTCDQDGLPTDLPGTCVLDARESQLTGNMSMNQPGG